MTDSTGRGPDGGAGGGEGRSDSTGSQGGNQPTRRRLTLTGISSRAWEHPADRGALVALRELRGFDEILRKFFGLFNERYFRMKYLGSAIRANGWQYSRVHGIYLEAAAALDFGEPADLPELYVSQTPFANAGAFGMDKPFIVVNSATVQMMDDDELRFVLGHELGHIRSGHAVYHTLLVWLVELVRGLNWIPLGALALRGIVAALMEWYRKAELSSDRAGLLAGQDPAAALRVHMKFAGGGDLSDIDTAAFLAQANEYDRANGDLRDSFIKLMLLEAATHPMPVARAAELRHWVETGEYRRILSGDYARREDDADASVSEEVKAAAKSYRDAFARSQDPLAGLLRRFGDGANVAGDWAKAGADKFRAWVAGDARRGEDPGGDDD
ncbi:M48 family metallopeptidase [Actinocatenispora rupis]|uniref:Zn-dependent protease n=1 Tax=Actinocatenispora rupis TaxID=519421 RepID=A0A8J3J739_9ACTN|nr:M48 family metallopeptidase [Actinocatenispora rupis]GID11367.1 Zn-dependent protease [Actinocatenispora rupis]